MLLRAALLQLAERIRGSERLVRVRVRVRARVTVTVRIRARARARVRARARGGERLLLELEGALRLQPYVTEAATVCNRGCNRMYRGCCSSSKARCAWRVLASLVPSCKLSSCLASLGVKAATLCIPGCNPMHPRLQPYLTGRRALLLLL